MNCIGMVAVLFDRFPIYGRNKESAKKLRENPTVGSETEQQEKVKWHPIKGEHTTQVLQKEFSMTNSV